MGKPSIFSREYEKRMKRRRIKITIIICLLLAGALYASKDSIKNIVYSNMQKNTAEDNKQEENKQSTPAASEEDVEKLPEDKVEEKSYDIALNDINVKVIYESKDGTNKLKYISTDNTSISFNINPSSTGMVIFNGTSQGIWFVDADGKVEDISDMSYKSYKRDTILKKRPEYVWCTLPKFIDDENIAYFSQLPYIGKSSKKYLWVMNVKNKNKHISKTSIRGNNLQFGDIESKGLEVILDDGSSRFISVNNGSVSVSK